MYAFYGTLIYVQLPNQVLVIRIPEVQRVHQVVSVCITDPRIELGLPLHISTSLHGFSHCLKLLFTPLVTPSIPRLFQWVSVD
jgi:hypothetical protein